MSLPNEREDVEEVSPSYREHDRVKRLVLGDVTLVRRTLRRALVWNGASLVTGALALALLLV